MPSTDANAPSSSGAVEAPVQTPTLKCSPRALASVIRELREETSSAPETREHAIDYHGRILRRVADRDSEGARDEMREHLVLTEEYMERFRVRPRNSPAAS